MKRLIFITLLLASINIDTDWFALFEADYFVNATTGDNDNSGRYPWAAWKDFTPFVFHIVVTLIQHFDCTVRI